MTEQLEENIMCGSSGEDLTAYDESQIPNLKILSPKQSEVSDASSL